MAALWQKTKAFFTLRLNSLFLIITLLLVILVLVFGWAVYFFRNMPNTKQVLSEQKVEYQDQAVLEVSNDETDSLYNKVQKIMLLPDEKPKVSTVKGADKLKEDPFFRNARDGDKVLVFEQSKRAILYNPTEHRIIEVGKVQINKAATTPSVTPSATPSAGVAEVKSITVNPTGVGYLRVRENPTTGSSEVGRVLPGDEFNILEEQNGWYRIEFEGGKFGWVSGEYVTIQ